MDKKGENFILNMGQPVRIIGLARNLIRLSGLETDKDIEIRYAGVRNGEKLFEELETDGEHLAKTRHPKIYIGTIEGYPPEKVRTAVGRLNELAIAGEEKELREYLTELLPEAQLSA